MTETFVLEEAEESEDKSAWVPVEDDTVLEANLLDIQRVTKKFKDDKGNFVERVQFTFEVTQDGDYFGRKLRGETSTLFNQHPNCKMRQWVQEILATDLPAGFKFDPEAVKGSRVRILIGKKERPRSDGQGIWVENWIKDVWRQKPAMTTDPVKPKTEDDLEPF